MMEPTTQPVVIHFMDGGIRKGRLLSELLFGRAIEFLPDSDDRDRRRDRRLTVIKEVRIEELGVSRATDMSALGMFVDSLSVYSEGKVLSVDLKFPGESFRLTARVVYNEPGIGMGIEFANLSLETKIRLDLAVREVSGEASGISLTDRRSRRDRRDASGQAGRDRWMESRRPKPDRRKRMKSVSAPVTVELSRIKAIFFQTPFDHSRAGGREASITFRDGEKITVRMDEESPEAKGIFAEMSLGPHQNFALYVVKSAIATIEFLP